MLPAGGCKGYNKPMTPQARKTLNLSLAVAALACVHFFVAYQFVKLAPDGFNVGAVMFVILGLAQLGLGLYGVRVALRRR
jgi:hypothetical protein